MGLSRGKQFGKQGRRFFRPVGNGGGEEWPGSYREIPLFLVHLHSLARAFVPCPLPSRLRYVSPHKDVQPCPARAVLGIAVQALDNLQRPGLYLAGLWVYHVIQVNAYQPAAGGKLKPDPLKPSRLDARKRRL